MTLTPAEIAAQCWCDPRTSDRVMDTALGQVFAEKIEALQNQLAEAQADMRTLAEALIWCSGSADFCPGGTARIGWVKGPQAVLARPGVKRVMEEEQDAIR